MRDLVPMFAGLDWHENDILEELGVIPVGSPRMIKRWISITLAANRWTTVEKGSPIRRLGEAIMRLRSAEHEQAAISIVQMSLDWEITNNLIAYADSITGESA